MPSVMLIGLDAQHREDPSLNTVFYLVTSIVSWKSKKQPTISKSSAESEYRSMASTICEIMWIHYILNDLQVKQNWKTILHCDNQTAIHIASNPIFHERTKYI